eukprot:CAMPEP_0196711810 /NCGR_PEP_ID=MMETSP1090-20130531/73088_1 /TAXON_ID=37098 /ORGANISM="Isochrysis sp, Strain CCMP1244" /LENGTH=192 /DNA_ID=CAMNT_0042051885 /DNA_START=1 /DNA_END=577 /DNA_ORIENTATION=+
MCMCMCMCEPLCPPEFIFFRAEVLHHRGGCGLVLHHIRKVAQPASAQGMRDRGEVARSPEALRPCQRRVEVHDGVPPASRERDHLARPLHQVDLAKALAAESWQHFVHEFARAARQVQPEACSGAPDQIGARRVERLAWHRGREEDPPFVAHEECVPRAVAPWILVDERSRALWARKQPAPHRSVVVLGSRA